MQPTYIAVALAAALASTSAANAITPAPDAQPAANASASEALSTGEVRKVDSETKKITIRHGVIENLGMPPMTMVFRAADPALLEGLKAGDKIRFRAEQPGGAYTVMRIERQ